MSGDFNKTRYTHRDYESLKEDLISAIPSLTKKWTSTEDSSPGIVLIKLMSMVGDNLSYNMDKSALEVYKDSVTQRKNCAKVLSLLGYKMHWYRSARVRVNIQSNNQIPRSGTNVYTYTFIPFETNFSAENKNYVVYDMERPTKNTVLRPGGNVTLNLIEGTVNTLTFSSDSITDNKFYFGSNSNIDETAILLYVNGSLKGKLVDNLSLVPDDYYLYFEFDVDEYGIPYIKLSDNWKTVVGNNASFTVKYILSSGSDGSVSSDVLKCTKNNSAGLNITHLSNHELSASEPYNSPGYNPQTVSEGIKDADNYLFTYDTLVTPGDFEKSAKRTPLISSSRLVDRQTIIDNNIDEYELVVRDHESQVEIKAYNAYMYLVSGDFENNAYNTENVPGDIYYDDVSNMVREVVSEGEGQLYFKYKPLNNIIVLVDKEINDCKVINIDIEFTTTKVYPFKLSGKLYFIEPLTPTEIVDIVDNQMTTALNDYFSPRVREYSQKPDLLEIVDVIKGSDSRIRYYDADDSSPVNWVGYPDGVTGKSSPTIDHTSFVKFQGLYYPKDSSDSKDFSVDSKFMTFKVVNVYNFDCDLNVLEDESGESMFDTDPGHYEPIDIVIAPSESATISCDNLRQLRTLEYYISTGQLDLQEE